MCFFVGSQRSDKIIHIHTFIKCSYLLKRFHNYNHTSARARSQNKLDNCSYLSGFREQKGRAFRGRLCVIYPHVSHPQIERNIVSKSRQICTLKMKECCPIYKFTMRRAYMCGCSYFWSVRLVFWYTEHSNLTHHYVMAFRWWHRKIEAIQMKMTFNIYIVGIMCARPFNCQENKSQPSNQPVCACEWVCGHVKHDKNWMAWAKGRTNVK